MILHVPYSFYPDVVGGTEIYVESLINGLLAKGVAGAIAVPAAKSDQSVQRGISVHRYQQSTKLSAADRNARKDAVARASFHELLSRVRPRAVHFHAQTAAIAEQQSEVAAELGIASFLTYHTPTQSCRRGTLLEFGQAPCDGAISGFRCARCALHGLGMPKTLASACALLPTALSRAATSLPGKLGTAAGMRYAVAACARSLQSVIARASAVVAVCAWVRDVLIRNGVPERKIRLSRQGLRSDFPHIEHGPASLPRRLVFMGRADRTKGIDVIVRAFTSAPELAAQLELNLAVQADADAGLLKHIRQCAAADARISLFENRAANEIYQTLASASAVVVPSRWMESGPLTVLEAHAAGVPVLGSDRGGIAELVQPGVNGALVAADDVEAWRGALGRIVNVPSSWDAMRSSITTPRTTAAVVDDHLALYREFLDVPA
jgi:glycosyltransferase involved in cell wall biosynthesis